MVDKVVLDTMAPRRARMMMRSVPSHDLLTAAVCTSTMATSVLQVPLDHRQAGRFNLMTSSTLPGLPSLLFHAYALPTCNA